VHHPLLAPIFEHRIRPGSPLPYARIRPGSPLPYACTPLAGIAPVVAGAYLNPAVARYSAPNNVHFIDVTAGVQQGDVFGSTLFCAGLHPLL